MSGFVLDPSQRVAVDLLVGSPERVAVMTGGPGTGKTTCARNVLDRFDGNGTTYALCSPTGKAAKRLSESTGREASTVHRLLQYEPASGGFAHGKDVPLDVDVVLVDEASMLDIELFASLVEAMDSERGARLLLVGDADQLPSVGAGQVLADLVAAPEIPTARLTTLHRAAEKSWVCRNARRIVAGDLPELEGDYPDFRYVECEDSAEVLAAALDAMVADPAAQVLTPQNPGSAGTMALNLAIQGRLNPGGAVVLAAKPGDQHGGLRVGDRVIQTRNNYTIDVFNGEVGTVLSGGGGALVVDFGDRRLEFSGKGAFDLRLAYALTVHKSQGSEWPHVIVIAHSTHTYMLSRHLFYTAVTRAKERVTLVGNRGGIIAGVCKGDAPRKSSLLERLRGEAAA